MLSLCKSIRLYKIPECSGVLHICERTCAQSCLTLCNPTDCSPPGRILQARILEHFQLQGIFPIQRLNPRLLSCALASRFFTTEPPRKPRDNFRVFQNWPQRKKLLNILCLRRVMKIKKDGNHPKDNIIMNIHLKNKKMWHNTACLHSYWTMGMWMQLHSAMYGLCCT